MRTLGRYTATLLFVLLLMPQWAQSGGGSDETPTRSPSQPVADELRTRNEIFKARAQIAGFLLQDIPPEDYATYANEQVRANQADLALVTYLIAEKTVQQNASARYGIARILSHFLQTKDAIKWLEKAEEAGFWNDALASTDPWLKPLEKDPTFDATIAKMRERRIAELPKHFIVVAPKGEPPKGGWPIMFVLHGYLRTGEYFRNVAERAANAGFVAVAPDGISPMKVDAYGWPDDNLEGTHLYLQMILKTLEGRSEMDRSRVFVSGFSQGGMHAACLLARFPEHYAGGVVISAGGLMPTPSEMSDPKKARPLYLIRGRQEGEEAAINTIHLMELWAKHQMPVDSVRHDFGHATTFPGSDEMIENAMKWILSQSSIATTQPAN